jgi:hypothetical protein
MNKIVRRVLLVSLLLLLLAAGSCYVGELESQNAQRQDEKYMEASGYKIYDGEVDTLNYWSLTGFLLIFGSVGVGIAGWALWEQDKNDRR